jgi:superfamily II DNA/RNA helicase
VQLCPRDRQTLLFSATISSEVESLVMMSLHNPADVKADTLYNTAENLQQQFVRVRKSQDNLVGREAALLALGIRSFNSKTIVFFRSKRATHRSMILFGAPRLLCAPPPSCVADDEAQSFCGILTFDYILKVLAVSVARTDCYRLHRAHGRPNLPVVCAGLMGLKAAELHGNLTQLQRLESLEKFRDGQVQFLVRAWRAPACVQVSAWNCIATQPLPGSKMIKQSCALVELFSSVDET